MDNILSKEILDEINSGLENYERELGLPEWTRQEAPEYLSINFEELKSKQPDELAEAVVALNQYSFNIQRAINRQMVWKRWGSTKLDELTAHYIPEVGSGYGFNERILMARNSPEICKKVNSFLLGVQSRLDRLYNLPEYIRHISDSIREMKFVALQRQREYSRGD